MEFNIWWRASPEQVLERLSRPPQGYYAISHPGTIIWVPREWNGGGAAVCAHVDTVFDADKTSLAVTEEGLIVSADPGQGIGADDRAGIAVARVAATRYPGRYCYLFFDKEERGAVCSNALPLGFAKRFDCFIGLDRRGTDQAALYGYENKKLTKMLKDNGATTSRGSMSDCSVLARRTGKCCFNLSVGFNHEHSPGESLDLRGMRFALEMLGKFDRRQFKGLKPDDRKPYFSRWFRGAAKFTCSHRDWWCNRGFASNDYWSPSLEY